MDDADDPTHGDDEEPSPGESEDAPADGEGSERGEDAAGFTDEVVGDVPVDREPSGPVDIPADGSDPTIDGDTVARLVGPDIAEALGVRDRRFTPAEVDALTDALREGTELAEAAVEGDPATLAELFDPPFMARYTDFADFESFLASSPWFESDVHEVFAGRRDGEAESPAAASSSFVERTTSFSTPGEMVTNAVLDRCRRRVEAAE